MVEHVSSPKLANDVDRFRHHCLTNVHWWPAMANDVLVQVLATSHAQIEAPRHQRSRSSRCLGDDRRMDSHGRTGHAGANPELVRRRGNCPKNSPYERAFALGVDPGMVMVGDRTEFEAEFLRLYGLRHQINRRLLLGRKRISKYRHDALLHIPGCVTVVPRTPRTIGVPCNEQSPCSFIQQPGKAVILFQADVDCLKTAPVVLISPHRVICKRAEVLASFFDFGQSLPGLCPAGLITKLLKNRLQVGQGADLTIDVRRFSHLSVSPWVKISAALGC